MIRNLPPWPVDMLTGMSNGDGRHLNRWMAGHSLFAQSTSKVTSRLLLQVGRRGLGLEQAVLMDVLGETGHPV
jgi:hypothetical protein